MVCKRNIGSFILTLIAFNVCFTCVTADIQAKLLFSPNPPVHVLCDVLDGRIDASSQFQQCLWRDVNIVPNELDRKKLHTVRSSDGPVLYSHTNYAFTHTLTH